MTKDLHPIEAAALVAMAVAWATITVVRLLLVPLIALAVVLLRPAAGVSRQQADAHSDGQQLLLGKGLIHVDGGDCQEVFPPPVRSTARGPSSRARRRSRPPAPR